MGLNDCIKKYDEAVAILAALGYKAYHVADLYENGFTAKIKDIGYMICVAIIEPTDKNNYTPENINRRVTYVILHK